MSKFTHLDKDGNAIMVDVSDKIATQRLAVAKGEIIISPKLLDAIKSGTTTKGDVLGVARVAGIMGAKKTSSLIPLCHPISLNSISVDFEIDEAACSIEATCTAKIEHKTGVEMEALTGVSIALLTVYDMCKAIDKSMVISNIRLVHKTGGKSGEYAAK